MSDEYLLAPTPTLLSQDTAGSILNAFDAWLTKHQIQLYPAQETAILELLSGKHVILNTPTGSGKSLVALSLHYAALSQQQRSYYTCPIKALVSEKFFSLCKTFGPDKVGMLTGDASINRDAPIVCCTAEILANMALSQGKNAPVDAVIMDEFHYYADNERGMAWQIPLLTLPQAQFLLMSATLGDCQAISRGLQQQTGRPVMLVQSSERPVPLEYQYRETPLHETLGELVASHLSPVYVVHFTQRECVEEAQNALSLLLLNKTERQLIAHELENVGFDSPFGKDMRRFVANGVGLHHAGLLPKYRLLVEKLAQQGLLKLIMGTDTLGVGINIPIRSVLFTKLCKFDGQTTALLKVRDFKQIAGRAGRQGYDTQGTVWAQAPEHVIENKRQESRVADNPAKKRKLVKKKPPQKNYVPWDATTLQKLINEPAEPLQSQFVMSHALLLQLLQSSQTDPPPYKRLIQLIGACHDRPAQKSQHRKRAAMLFKTLRQAKIVDVKKTVVQGNCLVLNQLLQADFSLNQSLALYVLDTLPLLDATFPTYGLDVLTLVEAVLPNPHVIINKQIDVLKEAKMAELKAEGVEFNERIAQLDNIEHPKPNREFIYETFNAYAKAHPWVGTENIYPKSIARDIFERYASFNEYIREYNLHRTEGVLLRYISQVYRLLNQTVPDAFKDDAVHEISDFFKAMLSQVDASLLQEWGSLLSLSQQNKSTDALKPPAPRPITADLRRFTARLRMQAHRLVKALSLQDYQAAAACIVANADNPWSAERLAETMAPYHAEYGRLLFEPKARQPHLTRLQQLAPQLWQLQQTLCDSQEDNMWVIEAHINTTDLTTEHDAQAPLLCLERIGM